MGGPGFLGLELDAAATRPTEWLVLCLWGAAEWCLFDGVPIEAHQKSGLKEFGTERFEKAIAGDTLASAQFDEKSCELLIARAGGGALRKLEVPANTRKLPVYFRSGRRRRLGPNDSLLDAWILSPTRYLYV